MANFYEVRIAGIETRSLSLAPKPKDFIGKIFNFDLAAEDKVDAKKSVIIVNTLVNIRQDEGEEVLANCFVLIAYELKDFKAHIKTNEEGLYIIPEDLDFQLRNISISTTRGILHSFLKGTYLAGATLPIIGQIPILKKAAE
jgi:hypothetical protein